MGLVIYRRITNVYEVPREVLEEFAGKGLAVSASNEHQFDVDLGNGLVFDEQDRVAVCPDDINCMINPFPAGVGLVVDEAGKVNVNLEESSGLQFTPDKKVAFDTTIKEDLVQTITNITDVNFVLDGRKLTLQKTFTDYHIKRNQAGVVLGFETGESRIEKQDVVFTDYGYCGYGSRGVSKRTSSTKFPNFYQK